MSCLYHIVFFSMLVVVCKGQETNKISEGNIASSINGSANSGNFNAFQGITNYDVELFNKASHNQAESVSGDARSGNSLFFAGGENGFIDGSKFESKNYAFENKAVSQTKTANSGQQSVFNAIENNSEVNQFTVSAKNEATVSGVVGDGKPSAISGVETQALTVDDSEFYNKAISAENSAVNTFKGKAVSGTATSVGQAEDAELTFKNVDVDNIAVTSDGRAISGAQNNVASSTDSSIESISIAYQNTAVSQGGDGVAGVQNNVGTISGAGPNGQASLNTTDFAYKNIAVSKDDGKAISGINTNIVTVQDGAVVDIDGKSISNRATTTGSGDVGQDAVAGVAVIINDIQDSTVDIDAQSYDNIALNYHYDPNQNSDAIAGVAVTIGAVKNSDVKTDLTSTDNYAMAKYGDAIAGNYIDIISDQGGNNFDIYTNLQASNNYAKAMNDGSAIVDSVVSIGGNTAAFVPQTP